MVRSCKAGCSRETHINGLLIAADGKITLIAAVYMSLTWQTQHHVSLETAADGDAETGHDRAQNTARAALERAAAW